MKKITKTNNTVSVNLLLATGLFMAGLFMTANAETSQKIFLNTKTYTGENLRFEKVSTLPCTTQTCFKRPNDAVISNDGSFILVVDSSNPGITGINLKKFTFSGGNFTDALTLPLIQKTTNSPLLNLSLSQNNTRAAIYREPTEGENTLVQLVDLSNNSIKELSSVNSGDIKIGEPAFLDQEGKKLIAGTLDLSLPQLVIIDLDSDSISNKLSLSDKPQSVNVSPNFKQAVITYSADLGQSVSVYNIANNSISTLSLNQDLGFAVDDFLGKVSFDLSGNKAALSSLGGNHVLHLLDLKNNKLTPLILDKTQDGPTISAISPDGKTVISIGSVLKKSIGFKVYKSIISTDGTVSQITSIPFLDGSIALDVAISPDQNKIYILELKNNAKQLKILNAKDLTQTSEINVSSDNTQSFLSIEPNGRYAITPNTKTEASVSTITDLNSAPILKSIVPAVGSVNGGTAFTINGFVDLTRLASTDVKICFKGICSTSSSVSRNGQTITGITPKASQAGLSDVTLSAKLISDGSTASSRYEDIFQFVKDTSTITDNIPPDVIILAPKDSSAYNTKRIRVLGKADGTGSQVDSVLVNGNAATLDSTGLTSPNIINFSRDVEFNSEGASQITVTAKDKSNNTTEKIVKIIIDTVLPTITANVSSAGIGQFNVSGTVNGTGTGIASIVVNSLPVQFTEGENVTFSTTTNSVPVTIVVSDKAGNKNQVQLSGTFLADSLPPAITVSSPSNGQIFKDNPTTTVTFSVTDNSSVSTVTLNGKTLQVSSNNQYSENLILQPGENSVLITASDSSENKSTSSIKVSFIPPLSETVNNPSSDSQNGKEVITLPPAFDNLNNALINELTDENGKAIEIGNTSSIELSNPPAIPDGEPAEIDLPKGEGLDTQPSGKLFISKGFSFATNVSFNNDNGDTVTVNDENDLYTAVLIDAAGRTFVVGFAFLKKPENNNSSRAAYKFQTTDGTPLNLITTLTVPGDANEGDARVSIISKNDSLATIPLNVTPSKQIFIGKKAVARPQIKEPISATI